MAYAATRSGGSVISRRTVTSIVIVSPPRTPAAVAVGSVASDALD
jgi:hypothetical protein